MIGCRLKREARFTDSARSHERDEAALGIGDQLPQVCQFAFASDEGSQMRGKW